MTEIVRRELWLNRYDDFINCCSYSHSGSTIISGSDDSTIRMWDAHIGEEFRPENMIV